MDKIRFNALRELRWAELREASQLLGRGMCHNPINIRIFGIRDAEHRCRSLTQFFESLLRGLTQRGVILAAFRGGAMVGIYCMAPRGRCQPTPLEKMRLIPSVVFGNSVGASLRLMKWAGEWSRRDLLEPHWHLGPVAVDAHLQNQGIGSMMMTDFCARMDAEAATSYLETDKSANVHFYEKFGFQVMDEAEVLGVHNWFMSRPGAKGGASGNGRLTNSKDPGDSFKSTASL